MKKEKLFNLLLDSLVVFSILAAMYVKQVYRPTYPQKFYGEMRVSPKSNEKIATIYRPGQEVFSIKTKNK